MTTIIRIILTVILLGFVWKNSHWSVALAITLDFIYFEANTYLALLTTKRLQEGLTKP